MVIHMTRFLVAVAAVFALNIGVAHAEWGCGPGCHSARNGECVIDGWGNGARWNECPAGARPRPPCGEGYVWRPREKACTLR